MRFDLIVGSAIDAIGIKWLRGNAELSIGVMRGSFFIRLRRADGVTTQWDFTSEESVKQIRDLCDRFLEAKSHADK